ncbi:hypothetical protein IJG72_00205 [bacterium]|nr:hypothetical protein [bacterium]
MILNFLRKLFVQQKCTHSHVDINKTFEYCPDCGALIENEWYIVKCSCCGIKEKATIKNGKVVPLNNFCHNCGTSDYIVEKLSAIDFININYAVLVQKETQTEIKHYTTQCWVDNSTKRNDVLPKLLPLYR